MVSVTIRRWLRCTFCRHRWTPQPDVTTLGLSWETCDRCDWTRPLEASR